MEAIYGSWKADKSTYENAKEFLDAAGVPEEQRAAMSSREEQATYTKEGDLIKCVFKVSNSPQAGEKTYLIELGKWKEIESFEGYKMNAMVEWDGSKFIETYKGQGDMEFMSVKMINGDNMKITTTTKGVTMSMIWRKV